MALLTVLMASYNGAATLPHVLDAYCALQAPPGGWRLLLVDNGSTDDTAAIAASYADRLPLSCLAVPGRGKNLALNAGIVHLLAQGVAAGLLVFSDDDAIPEPGWLCAYARCAAAQPGYAVFGGAILPAWQQAPPAWIGRVAPQGLTYGLTASDLAEGPVFPGLVWGANMALRMEILAAGHRFDSSLGPNGAAYAMGGETEFTRRLDALGYRAWFCSEARVAHIIRPWQLTRDYVLGRAWRFGRGQFRQQQAGRFPEWLGVPRWMLARYLLECLACVGSALAGGGDRLLRHRWELAYLRGYFHEAWGSASDRDVLITSHSGELGGMELRMAQEARFLQGVAGRCVLGMRTFPGLPAWRDRLRGEGLRVVRHAPPLVFERWRWRRLRLWYARLVWLPLQWRRRPRLVHVALCWNNYGMSCLWGASRRGVPAVLSVHNAFAVEAPHPWYRPLLHEAFSVVRGVYAVSPSALERFLAVYQPYLPAAAQLAVIPNCVDTGRYTPSAALRAAARSRWRVPQDALLLGSVGRWSVQKQPGQLLRLFALLRAEFPGLCLMLAGAGPLERELRRQARALGLEAGLVMTGFVEDVAALMPALDLHLLLSRNEGFGIATIEAMACGVPVAATDVAGSADILRGSAAGILLPPHDLVAAAAMVATLLRDPARRAAMGGQGRRTAEERYSTEAVGRQVRDFYARLPP
ncbi:glycosyltransferase [Oxalobacteraceae bacterium A2-2]